MEFNASARAKAEAESAVDPVAPVPTGPVTKPPIAANIVGRIASEPDHARAAGSLSATQVREVEMNLPTQLNRLLFAARDLQMFLMTTPKVAPVQFDPMKQQYVAASGGVQKTVEACAAVESAWPQAGRDQWAALRQLIAKVDERFMAMLAQHGAAIHDTTVVPAEVKSTMGALEPDLVKLEQDMKTLHETLIAAGRG